MSFPQKLQLDSTLTLEKATSMAQQTEQVKQQQSDLRPENGDHAHSKLEALQGRPKYKKYKGQRGGQTQKPGQQSKKLQQNTPVDNKNKAESTQFCGWCGNSPKHARKDCAARNAICSKCSLKGHYGRVC